jgi:hypothetical protein
MKLKAAVAAEIRETPDAVFEYLTSADNYATLLKPLFPLAGIQSVELIDANAPAVGVRRRVRMTDGMELVETIDHHEPSTVHGYSWGEGLRPPLSLIVSQAVARWDFSETDSGTMVNWTYDFTLTSPLVWPLAKPIFLRFRTWMDAGLRRAQSTLDITPTEK